MEACVGGMWMNRGRKYVTGDDRGSSGIRGRKGQLVKKSGKMEKREEKNE